MHYQCGIVSAILLLCDLLSNFFSKWLGATWNGLFLTRFSHTEALKLCFQRGAALYYLKWLMYRKLCIWPGAKKVLNVTLIHLPLLYVKKKKNNNNNCRLFVFSKISGHFELRQPFWIYVRFSTILKSYTTYLVLLYSPGSKFRSSLSLRCTVSFCFYCHPFWIQVNPKSFLAIYFIIQDHNP